MLFVWALAWAVLVSGLFGYGTDFSNALACGWFAVFSVLLLAWPRMNLFWHRGIAVVILLLIVTRWSMSWLSAEAAERLERLRKAANTDTLTGIANRRVVERALSLFATGQRRYAVMVVDIDHFEAINDQHGHDTGDRILQRIAEILKSRMRVQDTVARWGGEEFLVIVESVTRDEPASIAESLRQMIEAGTDDILKTTISIGVAQSASGQSADQILKRADEGLYAAKNSGRNKVVTV